TFGAGVAVRTFTVPILKDPFVDTPKTVQLSLGTPTWTNGPCVLDSVLKTAQLTIVDPNPAPAVAFGAASYTVNETTAKAIIVVKRTGDLAGTVTVDYATSDGTAVSSGPTPDFTATAGTLTFGPNVAMQTFSIPITNDTLDEGTESFGLALQNPTWS